jgi:hypothetical protein
MISLCSNDLSAPPGPIAVRAGFAARKERIAHDQRSLVPSFADERPGGRERTEQGMKIEIVGGRMGSNMARRLARDGHECVVFNADRYAIEELKGEAMLPAASLEALVEKLPQPGRWWLMANQIPEPSGPCGCQRVTISG